MNAQFADGTINLAAGFKNNIGAESPAICPDLETPQAFKRFFEREGYGVVRQALPAALCEAAKQAFLSEVHPDRRSFFKRHESGALERHVMTEAGWMKYPLMNFQDLPAAKYPLFRQLGLELLTHVEVQRVMALLFGQPGKIVHTMYFDGNQTTWAHRDGNYFCGNRGSMIGAWIAAEDIHPGAGRFYTLARSHLTPVPGEESDPNGKGYKTIMADFVRSGALECVAPLLAQGDMLVWNAMTIHGSLPTTDPAYSRRSFTAHYLPGDQDMRWKVGRARPARSILVNQMPVLLHGDQQGWRNTALNVLRTDYPLLHHAARRAARLLQPGRGRTT